MSNLASLAYSSSFPYFFSQIHLAPATWLVPLEPAASSIEETAAAALLPRPIEGQVNAFAPSARSIPPGPHHRLGRVSPASAFPPSTAPAAGLDHFTVATVGLPSSASQAARRLRLAPPIRLGSEGQAASPATDIWRAR